VAPRTPQIAAPARQSPAHQRAQRQNAQRATTGAASNPQSAQQQRLQQLQSRGRLSRSERREVQKLQRDQRLGVRPGNAPQPNAQTAQRQRLQQLQSQRRLSRSDRRELRQLQQQERKNAGPQQQLNQPGGAQTAQQQRLQQLQSQRHLSRSQRQELRQLQQQERQNAREQRQLNQPAATAVNQQPRAPRTRALSAQQIRQGRFAANAMAAHADNRGARHATRRAARLAARTAWQLGLLAPYVPWRGPVYWPYAYNDVFYYTFWPEAYDRAYWAYAYDDFFDGVFFPDGAPDVEYAAEGPYVSATTGSARAAAPGQITRATREFCAEQAKGITAWPFDKIAEAVQPTSEQGELLDHLKKAAAEAAEQLEQACPDMVPMTPPGRLQVMTMRLQATADSVKIIKPALEAFYNSLTDEQKARFNDVGPQLARQEHKKSGGEAEQAEANCSSDKAGLSGLATNRIEENLQPNAAQGEALDRLDAAMQKAVDFLREACPNTIPLTPVGRLDAMQKRLDAMIEAANAVRPALDTFYASLNDEQKAKFNRLGREANQSGG
jgi:LTXXQ motif family protein